ncbi:MAG: hypothetical protein AAF696_39505 [Bacteroidota bacterium]
MRPFRQVVNYFEADDLAEVRSLIKAHPDLLQRKDILGRALRHGTSLSMLKMIHELSSGDVQEALGFIEYGLKEEMANYLLRKGATFEACDVLPGCEALNAEVLAFSLKRIELRNYPEIAKKSIAMLLSTYSRNPLEKHRCLELMEGVGFPLEDTPPMALHRGDLESLKEMLKTDQGLFKQTFSEEDIYPSVWGIEPGDGLHLAPLPGGGLIHLAVEYDEKEILGWMLENGADPNFRSLLDEEGFGGHTALYHCTLSYTHKDARKAMALLKAGVDPDIRANLRKQLRYMGDKDLEKMFRFRALNAAEFARNFQVQAWVSEASIEVIENFGKP